MYPIEVIHEISKTDSRAKLNDIELLSMRVTMRKKEDGGSFVS
jgi:hypothetical protein